jgi:hypothetical protein
MSITNNGLWSTSSFLVRSWFLFNLFR